MRAAGPNEVVSPVDAKAGAACRLWSAFPSSSRHICRHRGRSRCDPHRLRAGMRAFGRSLTVQFLRQPALSQAGVKSLADGWRSAATACPRCASPCCRDGRGHRGGGRRYARSRGRGSTLSPATSPPAGRADRFPALAHESPVRCDAGSPASDGYQAPTCRRRAAGCGRSLAGNGPRPCARIRRTRPGRCGMAGEGASARGIVVTSAE
jgi:hypothetical protein